MIKKKIGVWMDHSHAQLLEYGNTAEDIRLIKADSPNHPQTDSNKKPVFSSASGKGFHTSNNEFKTHNIEQNKLDEYYKSLEHELTSYDEILLLGGKTAKEEFFNRIKDKQSFEGKKIYKMTTDHLTPNQFAAFVNEKLDENLAK